LTVWCSQYQRSRLEQVQHAESESLFHCTLLAPGCVPELNALFLAGAVEYAHRCIAAPRRCESCGKETEPLKKGDRPDKAMMTGMLFSKADGPQRVRVYRR
jgi:hypothetical protein